MIHPTRKPILQVLSAPPPDHAPTRVERVKAAAGAARVKADEAQQRLQDLRPKRASVDIAFCTLERDRVRGARLLAGALAYQFFFWLLPFALVLVGGIGLLGSVSSSAPDDLAKDAGVVGYLARSIHDAGADRGHAHVWALAIGLPALYFAGVAFVRALATAHALIWEVPAPKLTHKPMAALAMLGVVLAFVLSLSLPRERPAITAAGWASAPRCSPWS